MNQGDAEVSVGPLTAAAEAEWPSDELVENLVASATDEDRLTKVGPHPAAAEAGEPSVGLHIMNKTIERCAQVAKKTAKHWNVPDVVAEHIAAAIRALKNQP